MYVCHSVSSKQEEQAENVVCTLPSSMELALPTSLFKEAQPYCQWLLLKKVMLQKLCVGIKLSCKPSVNMPKREAEQGSSTYGVNLSCNFHMPDAYSLSCLYAAGVMVTWTLPRQV